MASNNAGRPYVLSGPSGVGKSALIRKLMNDNPGIFGFTVSHTTRAPRPDEKHGVDYYFVQKPEMQAMIQRNEFIEHVTYGDCQYGTSRQAVRDVLDRGRICIIDVDIQGAKSVRNICADMKPVCVFIKPPSFDELERRLRTVCGPDDVVRRRLDMARAELSIYDSPDGKKLFDYCICNDQLDRVCGEVTKIMQPSIDWSMKQKTVTNSQQQSSQPQPASKPPVMITPPVAAPTQQPSRSSSPQPAAQANVPTKPNVSFSPAQQQQPPPPAQQPQRPASPQPAPQAPPPAVVVPPPSSSNNMAPQPPSSPKPPSSPTPSAAPPPKPAAMPPSSPTPMSAPSSGATSSAAPLTPVVIEPPKPEPPKLLPPTKLQQVSRPQSGSGVRVPLPVNYDFPKSPVQPKASGMVAGKEESATAGNQAQDSSAPVAGGGAPLASAAPQQLPVPPAAGCCGATGKRSRASSPQPPRQADIASENVKAPNPPST